MVQAIPSDKYQRELRLFAVACVRRVWSLLPEECRMAVDLSESFANGRVTEAVLAKAVADAAAAAEQIYSGSCAPDARAYAVSAAVDASSVWPRTSANVLAATSCAASAVACAAAELVTDSRYDEAWEAGRCRELAIQATLLREIVDVSELRVIGKTHVVLSSKDQQLIRRLVAESRWPVSGSPDAAWVHGHAQRLGALPVGMDLWSWWFLTPNGEVILVEEGQATVASRFTERAKVVFALVWGSEKYPELCDVFPQREPDAVDCTCADSRHQMAIMMKRKTYLCPSCGGLGWLPAGDLNS